MSGGCELTIGCRLCGCDPYQANTHIRSVNSTSLHPSMANVLEKNVPWIAGRDATSAVAPALLRAHVAVAAESGSNTHSTVCTHISCISVSRVLITASTSQRRLSSSSPFLIPSTSNKLGSSDARYLAEGSETEAGAHQTDKQNANGANRAKHHSNPHTGYGYPNNKQTNKQNNMRMKDTHTHAQGGDTMHQSQSFTPRRIPND